MRRVVAHDEHAFAALYDRYAAQVNGVTWSILRSPALAEEATHDVFLRLWQQPMAFDPARGTFAGWLMRVARNRAIDVLRRRREDTGGGASGDVSTWVVDPAPGPEEQAIDRLRRQEVQQALSELAADHRQLLELAYFAGLSQSQIAERLDRPLGTVKSQIRAAMGRLADRLVESRESNVTGSFADRERRA
jgi:RNA polymerase sigma-70 factor (ECF subfamily)